MFVCFEVCHPGVSLGVSGAGGAVLSRVLSLMPALRACALPSGSFIPGASVRIVAPSPRPTGIPAIRVFYSGGSVSL